MNRVEQGRRLASQREDLIAQGADPAALVVPVSPVVTMVLVTGEDMSRPLDQRIGQDFTERAMLAIYCAEQQRPEHLWDLFVVRNVAGDSLHTVRKFGADQASTKWVAFLTDRDKWEPGDLHGLVLRAVDDGALAVWQGRDLVLVDREWWLANGCPEQPV